MAQDLEEIKRMSAQMLSDARRENPTPTETTPQCISLELRKFCTTLSSETASYIPVIPDDHGLWGWCSDGVTEKIKAEGGEHAYGWTIWEWPKVLWTAEFHDVWRSPTGNLIDITPKPGNETKILFLHDPTVPQDFDFDQRPGNRRQRIYMPPDTTELIRDLISNMKPSQRSYEKTRATRAGMSLEMWLKKKQPVDPLPKLIDALIAACNEHEAYFDSLGTNGYVRANSKLIGLAKHRLACQARLTKELSAKSRGN